MILARIVELGSLGVFAAASIVEAVSAALPEGAVLQFGALGLVGFMVAQNYRNDRRMAEVMDRKDAEIRKADALANNLALQFTEAVRELTTTLADRPCVAAADKSDNSNTQAKGKQT